MEDKHSTDLVCQYHNNMNELAFGKLNAVELDLMFCICSTMKNKGIAKAELSFSKIKEITNYSSSDVERFIKDLRNSNRKLMKLNFSIEDENEIIDFVLFTTFKINKKKEILTVSVNPDFEYILNSISGNFTRFELQEFMDISSKYGKVLYKQLKQFRKTGLYKISIDDFRKIFDVPKSYRMSEIDKKVLSPAIKELKPIFKGLNVKKIKSSAKGNPVTDLEFRFQKELGAIASGTISKEDKKTAAAIRDEDDLILKSMNEVPVFTEE